MRIVRATDYLDMSRKAANIISAQVIIKPESVLGLATGSSPVGIYNQLVEWYNKGDLDFRNITTVNLDEYVGLSGENPQSYRYFMNQHLFNRVNISLEKTYVPNGLELDAHKACIKYDTILNNTGRVDLQLLGLGLDGHIGFNEPNKEFSTTTHCVELFPSTIQANAKFFDSPGEVPTKAYTMGMKSIMSAQRILLIVSGISKGEILKRALTGPITPEVPGSILQLHTDVTVIADEEALSRMGDSNVD